VFWALREGRTELGFAIHILEEGEDRGDLVASGRYQIEPGTEIQEVYRRCAQAAAPQLLRAVRGCRAGELVRTPQPKEGAGRCPRPTFRDGRIEPGRPAEQVFGFVAGCAKDFSLFVEIAGDRFFVKRARSFDPRRTLPSEYVLDGETLFLACDPGVVVLELKPGGALFSAEYDEER
jgi:methionyl-tRNA formyltransferase